MIEFSQMLEFDSALNSTTVCNAIDINAVASKHKLVTRLSLDTLIEQSLKLH